MVEGVCMLHGEGYLPVKGQCSVVERGRFGPLGDQSDLVEVVGQRAVECGSEVLRLDLGEGR